MTANAAGSDRRTRVLMMIGALQWAGTPMHLYELVRHLDRSRFDVEICCLNKRGGLVERFEAAGFPVHDVDLPILYHPAFVPRLARLWRLIRNGRFDLVHTFLFDSNIFGAALARLAGTPVVVTSRRMDVSMDVPRRIQAYRFTNRWVDRIVTPSEGSRLACIEAEGVEADKVVAVLNGIDLDRVRNAPPAADLPEGDGPLLGAIGHLKPLKGHATLVEALPAIKERFPGVRVVVAGYGPLRSSLEESAARLGVADSLFLLGERSDVSSILKRLDLFVLPSNSEGMSNALLEAMACGLAVVATRVGGNPEVAADGVHGLLVPPRDPAAMARACIELLEDPDRRREMGRRGKARVESHFTVQRMGRAMDAFYEDLVRRPAATLRARRPQAGAA